ncbi:hypothetical protein KAV79_04895, partial [Candidatus Aerophobetes bacterium]|nr:hypothetical protein [Candidatus Aerophobetes bacterium]
MDFEEKVKLLEEKLQKLNKKKETLKRQIALSKEWISKLKVRMNKAKESGDCAWHSVARSRADILTRLKAELTSERKSLASLESEYSSVSHKVKLSKERLRAEQA